MVIRSIKNTRGGILIFLDEGSYLINKKVFLEEDIYEGKDICLEDLIEKSDFRNALEKARNYSSRSIKSSGKIKSYLEERGYSRFADRIVESLVTEGYVDDRLFCETYYSSVKGKKGIFYIRNKLIERGVPREIVYDFPIQENIDDVVAIIRKKYYKMEKIDIKTQKKMYLFLFNRGFSSEIIKKAINFVKNEDFSCEKG